MEDILVNMMYHVPVAVESCLFLLGAHSRPEKTRIRLLERTSEDILSLVGLLSIVVGLLSIAAILLTLVALGLLAAVAGLVATRLSVIALSLLLSTVVATTRLLSVITNMTDPPIPRAVLTFLETPRKGHKPKNWLKTTLFMSADPSDSSIRFLIIVFSLL